MRVRAMVRSWMWCADASARRRRTANGVGRKGRVLDRERMRTCTGRAVYHCTCRATARFPECRQRASSRSSNACSPHLRSIIRRSNPNCKTMGSFCPVTASSFFRLLCSRSKSLWPKANIGLGSRHCAPMPLCRILNNGCARECHTAGYMLRPAARHTDLEPPKPPSNLPAARFGCRKWQERQKCAGVSSNPRGRSSTRS
jgi:hypothetical protein